MQLKKASVRLGLSVLSVAILVPLVSNVNHFARISKEQIKSRTLQADGAPIPPLPPPKNSLVADGAPIPPLPPPKGSLAESGVLVADGAPIPPLPPPKGTATLVADGAPIPPLPPPKGSDDRTIQLPA